MDMEATQALQPEARTVPTYERVEVSAVPLEAAYCPWERVDWDAVNRVISAGDAVRIDLPDESYEVLLQRSCFESMGTQGVFLQ